MDTMEIKKTVKDVLTVEREGEWSGSKYRIRDDGSIIEEPWSCVQGDSSGGKYLHVCPPNILSTARREAAGELGDDEPDTEAMLADWLECGGNCNPIRTLLCGYTVQ